VTTRLAEISHLEKVGGKTAVLRIQAATPASSSITAYADTVARYAASRRAMAVGTAIIEAASSVDLGGVETVLERAPGLIGAPGPEVEPATQVTAFMAEQPIESEWVVRGTLERGDRVIVTGKEGGGKSVWLRQLGWQIALGRHPWGWAQHPRRRVLHVDCENSSLQVAKGYRMLAAVQPASADMPLWVTCRPQGLDLTSRRDAAWLSALVEYHRAEVLVIGPLYKLHRPAESGGGGAEEVAALTARALDAIRAAYGTVLLIEAHAPLADREKSDYRPFGSSFWLRWPEFGFGLVPAAPDQNNQRRQVSIEHWRGMRDDTRAWPSALQRMDGAGTWPWAPLGVNVEAMR
jgi:replicative DNA helicase